jgi:cell division protein FtsN
MAKDYAKSTNSKKKSGATSLPPEKESQSPSLWLIFAAIVAISALGYGLYTLSNVPEDAIKKPIPANTVQEAKPKAKPKKEPEKSEPDFDFYQILPNSEVTTSPVEAYKPDPAKAKVKYDYMLQTGSFKNQKDAERQKANIGFQGLRASVKKVTSKSGTDWYRVEVGPYKSRSKMNSAIDKLVAINIQPLVKKLPKPKTP